MNTFLKVIAIIYFGSILASPVYSGNNNTADNKTSNNYNGNTYPKPYSGSHSGHHSGSDKGGIIISAKVVNLIKAKVGIKRRYNLLDARAKVGYVLNAKVHIRRDHHDLLNVKARVGRLLGARAKVRRGASLGIRAKVVARL